jgi:hypothetical protein
MSKDLYYGSIYFSCTWFGHFPNFVMDAVDADLHNDELVIEYMVFLSTSKKK